MNLASMALAFGLATSGIAQAQYLPKNPLDRQLHEFPLEQKCTLWAEKHIGADHVPAECEIYVDPIPDTKEARDKVHDIQSSAFIQCMDEYIQAETREVVIIPGRPPAHGPGLIDPGSPASNTPHHNDAGKGQEIGNIAILGDLPEQILNSNMINGILALTLERKHLCQSDSAMTDDQVVESLNRMSKSWHTVSSAEILDPAVISSGQIKVLLDYWTKIITYSVDGLP